MNFRITRLARLLPWSAVLCTLSLAGLAQDIKIAVVDLDLIIARSSAGKQLQAKLEAFQKDAQSELQAKQQQLADIRRRGTEGTGTLSQSELAQLSRDFERVQNELVELQQQKQTEGQKMQQQGMESIQKLLEPVFEQVQKEGGYDVILNRTPGVVLFGSERVDITQRVQEVLDEQSRAGS